MLFLGKLRSRWDSPYVVLELFEGGSVLISNIKSGKQLKVNGHHLKPNLTSERPTPADTVNLHLPEVLEVPEDVTIVSPSPHQ